VVDHNQWKSFALVVQVFDYLEASASLGRWLDTLCCKSHRGVILSGETKFDIERLRKELRVMIGQRDREVCNMTIRVGYPLPEVSCKMIGLAVQNRRAT